MAESKMTDEEEVEAHTLNLLLSRYREKLGLTQARAAHRHGYPASAWGKMERGEARIPEELLEALKASEDEAPVPPSGPPPSVPRRKRKAAFGATEAAIVAGYYSGVDLVTTGSDGTPVRVHLPGIGDMVGMACRDCGVAIKAGGPAAGAAWIAAANEDPKIGRAVQLACYGGVWRNLLVIHLQIALLMAEHHRVQLQAAVRAPEPPRDERPTPEGTPL